MTSSASSARLLNVIASVLCFTTVVAAPPLASQRGAADAAPTFDQLARRVLTLKVQVDALRARLETPGSRGVGGGDGAAWQPVAWSDSLQAFRSGVGVLAQDARRLQAGYRSAHHDAVMATSRLTRDEVIVKKGCACRVARARWRRSLRRRGPRGTARPERRPSRGTPSGGRHPGPLPPAQ